MAAIQEDVLAHEDADKEVDANQSSDNEGLGFQDLQTVQEGNETNQMTTGEKGLLVGSQSSAQPIAKKDSHVASGAMHQQDENEGENYDEDDFDGQEDYEF